MSLSRAVWHGRMAKSSAGSYTAGVDGGGGVCMRLLLAAAFAMVPNTLFAQKEDPDANPEGYWNRGWNCGQAAESYSVTIVVEDAAAVFEKVDAAMLRAGAATQRANMSIYRSHPNTESGRQVQYSMPLKAGEKAAKTVWDFGELTNYSVSRHKAEDSIKAIDERIKLVQDELSDRVLDRLPAARYFLKSKLSGLRQIRASCESGIGRSTVLVNIQPKAKPGNP